MGTITGDAGELLRRGGGVWLRGQVEVADGGGNTLEVDSFEEK